MPVSLVGMKRNFSLLLHARKLYSYALPNYKFNFKLQWRNVLATKNKIKNQYVRNGAAQK